MDLVIKKIWGLLNKYLKEILFVFICCALGIFDAYFRPIIIQHITDEGMLQKKYNVVCIFCFLLIIFIIVAQISEIVQNINMLNIKQNIILELSVQAFDKLLHINIDFFKNKNCAEIIEQLNTDISSIGILLDQGFIYMFSFCIKIFPGLLGLFYINWRMAICIICSIPLKLLILHVISTREEKITSDLIEKNAKLNAIIADLIKGIKEVKLFDRYAMETEKFINKNLEILDSEWKSNMLNTYNITLENMLQGFLSGIFYLYGGYCVCIGEMSVGSVLAFISYSNYVTGPISIIININLIIARVKPSFRRLSKFFEQESESRQGFNYPKEIESLYVVHLKFRYNENLLLEDISFKAKKGEKIAIIGENGSGKSSLLYILLRLYELQEGNIFLNNENIENIDLKMYRAQFSVVTQFPYFFHETVRKNLDPNGEYSDYEILEVFKLLRMMDLYNILEYGFNTQIGVDSSNLSGGERQKLALIRAILKKAPILILDECTSNYDTSSEKWFYTQGLNILQNKIIICVTHQRQYLENFDRVYLLSKGKMSIAKFE